MQRKDSKMPTSLVCRSSYRTDRCIRGVETYCGQEGGGRCQDCQPDSNARCPVHDNCKSTTTIYFCKEVMSVANLSFDLSRWTRLL